MIRGGMVSLPVRDVSRAVRFYIETLGMKLVAEHKSSSILDAGEGFRVAIVASKAPGTAPPVGFVAKVPLDEAIAIYENRGVRFDVKTEDGAARAYFRDPDNNALFLFEA